MNIYIPFQILGIIFHGSFDALGGVARDLSTLNRTGDANLDINPDTGAIVVSGHLGLGLLHVSNLSALISFDRKKSPSYSIAVILRRGETICKTQYIFS